MMVWAVERCPLRLPTEIRVACGQSASMSGVIKASCSTTSASRSTLAPRTVMRSAAPGPAPISHTLPACCFGGWSDASDITEVIEMQTLKNQSSRIIPAATV